MPRQDLGKRALEFSAALLALNRRLLPKKERFGSSLGQLVRAGTSIGANVEEAAVANSRRDMAAKYAIALREAREVRYWLRVLATDPLIGSSVDPLIAEATEWVAMLTTTVKKLRDEA
jgi:four helix bundle protein